MKKYSSDYFEKKYRILFAKLVKKEGFADDVKAVRKKLGLPIDGFENNAKLAYFFITKLSKSELPSFIFYAFLFEYERDNKMQVTDANRKEVIEKFVDKKRDKERDIFRLLSLFDGNIESHHSLFTKNSLFDQSKYLSKLHQDVFSLMKKYWGVDLLDDHIILHYIEKYLFMGEAGVNQYIKNKVSCHNCKYIGVEHFSPERNNMDGQDEGPYSKDYVFNKGTVSMLSNYFHSVFLIVKPYATKELVIQYIEDNWDDLKEHIVHKNTFYRQYDVHPSIIKEGDEEKNRIVYELSKLSKKDLIKRYKGSQDFNRKGVYKEAVLSAILDEEYKIKMSPDAVKKSASRFRKSIKVQQMPKDIRDI